MPKKTVTDEQYERARGEGERAIKIDVSDEFLRFVNIAAAKRGVSNRDLVIESIILNGEEEF